MDNLCSKISNSRIDSGCDCSFTPPTIKHIEIFKDETKGICLRINGQIYTPGEYEIIKNDDGTMSVSY